jgi:hypothetical protein
MNINEKNKKIRKSVNPKENSFQSGYLTHEIMNEMVMAFRAPNSISAMLELSKSLQNPTTLNSVSQLALAMKSEQDSLARFMNESGVIQDLALQMDRMKALSDSLVSNHSSIYEIFRCQIAVFEKLSNSIISNPIIPSMESDFSQISMAWNAASHGLVNRLEQLDLLTQRPILSARLLDSVKLYSKFIDFTFNRLTTSVPEDVISSLMRSMTITEEQLLTNTDQLIGFVQTPEDNEQPERTRDLNAPYVQQDALLARLNLGGDVFVDVTSANVTPTIIIEMAKKILELITSCNEAGRVSKYSREFFKPTTRLLSVYHDLPWIIATDKQQFAEVVDCLYFIFYEGAGKDKLRFLDQSGGPLTDAECDFIWWIKQIRNKWIRHDPDHGEERTIIKSWESLSETFKKLGMNRLPSDPATFQELHLNLLRNANEFLELLLGRLTIV